MTYDAYAITADAHGYSGYTRGCKCPVCRAAKASYMRTRRAAARARSTAHTRASGIRYVAQTESHGTRYAFDELGCRCASCTPVGNAARRRQAAQ